MTIHASPQRYWLPALLLLLLAWSGGAIAADWQPGMQRLSLSPYLELLDRRDLPEDDTAVPVASDLPWRSVDPAAIQQGLPPGHYWLRARVHNADAHGQRLLLVNDEPAASSLSLYRLDADGQLHTLYADVGQRHAFNQRPLPHRKPMTELYLAPGEDITLIWEVRSERLLQLRATLWQPTAFQRHDHHRSLLYGMLYGALAVMALYNLFLALTVGERSYLHYVLYLLTIGYLVAADEGHVQQYLWPDRIWPVQEMYLLVYAGSLFAFFMFSVHFLELRRRLHRAYQALLGLCALSALLLLAGGLLELSWATRGGIAGATLLYLGALAAAVRVRMQGLASAGHYIIAIVSLVIGMLATNLATLGLLPHTTGMESYASIGASVMLVFFALALADRINQLREDNRRANAGIVRANQETQRVGNELYQSREERHRLEQLVSQVRDESQAKSDFLATIGHQVRTPMSSVLGMAELLKSTRLDTTQGHYIGNIERAGQALVELIGELLDYALVEAGEQQLDITPFNLETVLDDVLSIYALRVLERQISLIAVIDRDVPRQLQGDPRKLRQVLLALLNRALQGSDGGDVVIRVRRVPRAAVNGVELRFEVIDSDPRGLSAEERDNLFTPFRRNGDNAGHGSLGLAIARQLVSLMDGEIGVDSEPGSGNSFWFDARFFAKADDEAVETPLLGRRILLVEAHPLLVESLAGTLTLWGAHVDVATSADQALQTLGDMATAPDAILIDHQLPSGSGLQLASELATAERCPPLLLMTALSQRIEHNSLESSGIERVLEKPITFGQLREALWRLFGLSREQNASSQPRASLAALRVLVAEDNPVNRLVIQGMLQKLGIDPVLANDGQEALNAFRQEHFDCVLLDCEMPEMDGYQASRQMRRVEQQEGRKRARILAFSAHATSDHQERASVAGMDDYLTKPVSTQALEVALARCQQA